MSDQPMKLWLPYPKGVIGQCGQGAMSQYTHSGIHAWDFVLPPNTPIISVQCGRVIILVDDSTATGVNNGALANMIFVDLGGARFATYLHHKPNTALVEIGEIVEVGTRLAEVGSSGTISPHLHFDVRGGGWNPSHPVLFKSDRGPVEVEYGKSYQSATPEFPSNDSEPFVDSVLSGDEFLGNGIQLQAGLPAYSLSNEETIYRGSVLGGSKHVFFDLWRMGQRGTTLSVNKRVDLDGEFSLRINIPKRLTGAYWYRISSRNRSGSPLPVWINSNSG